MQEQVCDKALGDGTALGKDYSFAYDGEQLFGVAYYIEYLGKERIMQDIELMKKAHINVVRIGESTWSTYEKDDGEFDFSLLLLTLRKMHENGIKVIVGTPTYAVPSWLCRKHPEILATTPNGKSRYGARQQMDISHPTFRYYAERIIRKMMEAIKDEPGVIGYQMDNETKYYNCSSDNVQIGFVKYLKKRFKDFDDDFNDAFGLNYWSNRIDNAEDFPDVTGTINGSLACAFKEYQRSLVYDFLKFQRAIIEEYKKEGQFITHNFDFEWRRYSYGIQSDVDHFACSTLVDVMGVDIYHPSRHNFTGVEIFMGGDLARSVKQAPYFVLETEAQGFKQWTPLKGQLFAQGMCHAAAGARMVSYWHWHSIHNSFETYWKGLLSHDLMPNPVYYEACKLGLAYNKISDALKGFKLKAPVLFLVSNKSLSAIDHFPYKGHQMNFTKEHQYNDVFRKYYDAFFKLQIPTNILSVDTFDAAGKGDANHKAELNQDEALQEETLLATLKKYELVVVPALYSASAQTLETLRQYVNEGGHLLMSFYSGVTNENVQVFREKLPYAFADFIGSYNLIADDSYVEGIAPEDAVASLATVKEHCALSLVNPAASSNAMVQAFARHAINASEHAYYENFAECMVKHEEAQALLSYASQEMADYDAIVTKESSTGGSMTYVACDIDSEMIGSLSKALCEKLALVYSNNENLITRSFTNDKNEDLTFLIAKHEPATLRMQSTNEDLLSMFRKEFGLNDMQSGNYDEAALQDANPHIYHRGDTLHLEPFEVALLRTTK